MYNNIESDLHKKSKITYLYPESLEIDKLNDLNPCDGVKTYAAKYKPQIPIYFFRPKAINKAARFFQSHFKFVNNKSKILYSVKSNPDKDTLQSLFNAGITDFDVASLNEVALINGLFGDKVKMYFMHPIKSVEAISSAYFQYSIKDFSLDSFDELEKIIEATRGAKDLNLHVRLAIPRSNAAIELSTKFGILPSQASALIQKSKCFAKKIGICFHVGSQCMDPIEYRKAIMIASDCIKESGVKIDFLDIGGGFPSIYPTFNPPRLASYFEEIKESIKSINISADCEIWCEPGRAIVAESSSLLVRIELKKDNSLYINDGTYGGLFDAGSLEFTYPCKAIRINNNIGDLDKNKEAFSFFGPTCDSIDFMKGPFYLPKNIKQGDYIEIFQLGSYSKSMRTNFNGFEECKQVTIDEEHKFSIFDQNESNHTNIRMI